MWLSIAVVCIFIYFFAQPILSNASGPSNQPRPTCSSLSAKPITQRDSPNHSAAFVNMSSSAVSDLPNPLHPSSRPAPLMPFSTDPLITGATVSDTAAAPATGRESHFWPNLGRSVSRFHSGDGPLKPDLWPFVCRAEVWCLHSPKLLHHLASDNSVVDLIEQFFPLCD